MGELLLSEHQLLVFFVFLPRPRIFLYTASRSLLNITPIACHSVTNVLSFFIEIFECDEFVHIYRSFYKGTRLLCGGGGGGRGVRNRVTFSLIFVSIFDRNDFEIISKLERIDKNSSFFNEEMANGKREKKKNSTIKLIFRSKLFNQAIYLSFYNVDRAFRVHFIPTRCKEGSGNILKYQLVFNGTGQSFEIFAAFVSRIKGRYRFIQSFLICTRAHHSRETIPFLINETRVKASVQLNGSPLRPTPLNFIPGPKYEGKIDTFCPSCLRSSLRSSFTH